MAIAAASNGFTVRSNGTVRAGGTGEFFSLTGDEHPLIIKTAVDTCRGKVPIIAGAGGPALCDRLRAGSRAGGCAGHPAAAALSDRGRAEGIAAHVEAVCKSTNLGVIVYNRAQSRLSRRHWPGWRNAALT
jgi:5-dehydro-4-deoxyglucarate dehydratase